LINLNDQKDTPYGNNLWQPQNYPAQPKEGMHRIQINSGHI